MALGILIFSEGFDLTYEAAVSVKVYCADGITVGWKSFQAFTGSNVPNPYTFIERTTDKEIWLEKRDNFIDKLLIR